MPRNKCNFVRNAGNKILHINAKLYNGICHETIGNKYKYFFW